MTRYQDDEVIIVGHRDLIPDGLLAQRVTLPRGWGGCRGRDGKELGVGLASGEVT